MLRKAAALRPKVDLSFIFPLSGIYHQDDICSLYLDLSRGLLVEEPTEGGLRNEIIGSSVVVGLFDDGRFKGWLSLRLVERRL
ncbi:MAG: hypothetical protein DMG53_22940 [Acidobacteria bacterium]|nr:MAG: hypothetical protein DMG53_22940 [Acidobacteriota bacterium]